MERLSPRTWIFVSHASEDIDAVRRVRNYLEEKGASPLLFHLLALDAPEKFWPVIEQEIAARDFFLFCDSAAARVSPWVAREREVVEAARRQRVKRLARIEVDRETLDLAALDDFVARTRIFASFANRDRERVMPYLEVLAARGFEIFDAYRNIGVAADWEREVDQALSEMLERGYFLAFLSRNALESPFILAELDRAELLGGDRLRLLQIVIDPDLGQQDLPESTRYYDLIDAWREPENAPDLLADLLHQR